MTEQATLELALKCWNRPEFDDGAAILYGDEGVKDLASTGVFSISNIALILKMSRRDVAKIVTKTDKKGGRFNPEALPLIYDLWLEYRNGGRNVQLIQTIINLGVSKKFLSRLTGIPAENIYRWTRE